MIKYIYVLNMKLLRPGKDKNITASISEISEKQALMEQILVNISKRDSPVDEKVISHIEKNNELIGEILTNMSEISDTLKDLNRPWYSRLFCP